MFARTVSFRLKPGRGADFTKAFDTDVLPVLRQQMGFQDEIALIAPGAEESVAISLWDLKDNADSYARSSYASVLKTLQPLIEGTPTLRTYERVQFDLPQARRASDRLTRTVSPRTGEGGFGCPYCSSPLRWLGQTPEGKGVIHVRQSRPHGHRSRMAHRLRACRVGVVAADRSRTGVLLLLVGLAGAAAVLFWQGR